MLPLKMYVSERRIHRHAQADMRTLRIALGHCYLTPSHPPTRMQQQSSQPLDTVPFSPHSRRRIQLISHIAWTLPYSVRHITWGRSGEILGIERKCNLERESEQEGERKRVILCNQPKLQSWTLCINTMKIKKKEKKRKQIRRSFLINAQLHYVELQHASFKFKAFSLLVLSLWEKCLKRKKEYIKEE